MTLDQFGGKENKEESRQKIGAGGQGLERKLEGEGLLEGGLERESGSSKIWRGREKLEGALEREQDGDKISRTGRGMDGGIVAGRGLERIRVFSLHPGPSPSISVQCNLVDNLFFDHQGSF